MTCSIFASLFFLFCNISSFVSSSFASSCTFSKKLSFFNCSFSCSVPTKINYPSKTPNNRQRTIVRVSLVRLQELRQTHRFTLLLLPLLPVLLALLLRLLVHLPLLLVIQLRQQNSVLQILLEVTVHQLLILLLPLFPLLGGRLLFLLRLLARGGVRLQPPLSPKHPHPNCCLTCCFFFAPSFPFTCFCLLLSSGFFLGLPPPDGRKSSSSIFKQAKRDGTAMSMAGIPPAVSRAVLVKYRSGLTDDR